MPTVRRTEPRSPIEEQILQTIARLDGTVWKHSDEERQERDADVIMRSVVGPEIERRDAEIERQRAKLAAVRALIDGNRLGETRLIPATELRAALDT